MCFLVAMPPLPRRTVGFDVPHAGQVILAEASRLPSILPSCATAIPATPTPCTAIAAPATIVGMPAGQSTPVPQAHRTAPYQPRSSSHLPSTLHHSRYVTQMSANRHRGRLIRLNLQRLLSLRDYPTIGIGPLGSKSKQKVDSIHPVMVGYVAIPQGVIRRISISIQRLRVPGLGHDRIRLREPAQCGVVVAGVWNTKSRRATKPTKTRAAASVFALRALRDLSYLRDPNVPPPPATPSSTCPVKRRAVGVAPNGVPRDSPHGLYHNSAVRAPLTPSAVTDQEARSSTSCRS